MSVEDEAEEYVEQYADAEAKKAFQKLEKERHEKGCGCDRCKREAVSNWNSWVDWFVPEEDQGELYKASAVSGKRGITILLGDLLFGRKS